MPTPEIIVTHSRTCTLTYDPEAIRSLIRADAIAKSGLPDTSRLTVRIFFSSDNGVPSDCEEPWPMKIRASVELCENLLEEDDGTE